MKTITVYEDEISGKQFGTEEEAIKSEAMYADIRDTFAFVLPHVTGESCVQHSKEYYEQFREALIKMTNKYEKNIAKIGHPMVPYGAIGRCFDNVNSPLYTWFCQWGCICSYCYREWNQSYYAIHCSHLGSP